MNNFLDSLKQKSGELKIQIHALYLAYRDPRTPWYARFFAALVVAYAFSPVDLIPDFIPILGYLDDLILLPVGIKIALQLIRAEVMTDARESARTQHQTNSPLSYVVGALILLLWAALIVFGAVWLIRQITPGNSS